MKKFGPEKDLIRPILEDQIFRNPRLQRLLACYPIVHSSEKNMIIIDLMDQLWNLSENNTLPFIIFRNFDAELARIGKKGHFTHQFEVFILGWVLINKIIKKEGLNPFISVSEGELKKLFNAWLFTSTAHDFGYPIQVVDDIIGEYEKGYKAIYSTDIANRFKNFTAGYSLKDEKDLLFVHFFDVSNRVEGLIDIQKYINFGIVQSVSINKEEAKELQDFLLEKRNHGYISALILCRTYIAYMSEMGFWNSGSEKWRIEILRMASTAIALHALPEEKKDIINKFSFSKNPLIYLLYLLDNIQEWNRSLVPHDDYPEFLLAQCKLREHAIELGYRLSHRNWSSKIEDNAKSYIVLQKKRLGYLQKNELNLGLSIKIDFSKPDGNKFKTFNIKL